MVVAYKNIHWKVRPFERKGLSKVRPFWKKKRRRPSTKTVVAREIIHWKVRAFERPFKSQSLWKAFQKSDPFERKKGDDHQQRWSSPEIFFRMNIENIREKKLEKKRATPAFRRASLRPFFFGLFQTSDERTNRRSKAYSQRIAAENCSNDHNTPIFN